MGAGARVEAGRSRQAPQRAGPPPVPRRGSPHSQQTGGSIREKVAAHGLQKPRASSRIRCPQRGQLAGRIEGNAAMGFFTPPSGDLFRVGQVADDGKRPVDLLQEHEEGQFVGKGQPGKRQGEIRLCHHLRGQTVRPPDEKREA